MSSKASPDKSAPTVAELADIVGGSVRGEGTRTVRGAAPVERAGPSDIAILFDRRYAQRAESTKAGAVLVSEALAEWVPAEISCVVVDDARRALRPLLARLHPPEPVAPGVHPTAVLGRGVTLGHAVTVGPYAVLEDGVSVGDGTRVHAHVVVGKGASIGSHAVLHPHAVLYAGAVLGDRVVLHSGARVGVDGFGYWLGPDGPEKIPHVGECVLDADVEVGANSCVDRASLGATHVGQGVKLDNLVQLGHNVEVGPHTLMAAQVGIGGSVRVGAGTLWGGQSGAVDHQTVGDGARVAGKAGVSRNVPAGETVAGFPGRPLAEFKRALAGLYRLEGLRARVAALEQAMSRLQAPGG